MQFETNLLLEGQDDLRPRADISSLKGKYMNDKLTVIARVRAKAGYEARARDVLLGLIAPTRAEAGCINYDLHVSQDDPAQFVFYENWLSEAHLEAHANSPHLRAFRNAADEILDGAVEVTKWRMLP